MKVTLGVKASMFYDPSTALKVLPGQTVELTPQQETSSRVSNAIGAGHLRVLNGDNKPNVPTKPYQSPEELLESFKKIMEAFEEGVDPMTQAKSFMSEFTRDQLVDICQYLDIVPEEADTKKTLTEAILEDLLEQADQGKDTE